MARVVLGTPNRIRHLACLMIPGSQWIYLGKATTGCARIARVLGETARLPLGDRLHTVAEELRQPFLDFVAGIGALQRDLLGWYASTFAWKNWGASDLFLLICYEHLAARLVGEGTEGRGQLLIVVEDPWLYRQFAEVWRSDPRVTLAGKPRLWVWRLKAILFGLARRLHWARRIVWGYLIQRWQLGGRPLQGPAAAGAAFYSYPQNRCFHDEDGWTDPYLDGLDRTLEAAGFSIGRFSPPEAIGFERALAQRTHYFSPLVMYVTLQGLLRTILALWRPVWSASAEVKGLSVHWLARREWWWDSARASQFLYRLFFDCLQRFLKAGRWKLLVFPYENQPWEKLAVLAARQYGAKTVGYQHAIVPRLFLPMFLGQGESSVAPLPDVIFTSGTHSHTLLREGGTPSSCLVLGGSRRYRHLTGTASPSSGNGIEPAISRTVLVAVPLEEALAAHFLSALRKAFPSAGREEGITFLVKLHPAFPVDRASFDFPAEFTHESFEAVVKRCTVVVFTGSTTGLEALLLGRQVLRYRSDVLLDINHCEFLDARDIPVCGDEDLKVKLIELMRLPAKRIIPPADLREQMFSPVDEQSWEFAIRELAGAR